MRAIFIAITCSAAAMASAVALTAPAAIAAPLGPAGVWTLKAGDNLPVAQVQHRRRGGYGIGLGVGAAILGSAVIGSALARPYGYYPRTYYYAPGYAPAPTYYAPAPVYTGPPSAYRDDDADAYCFSRFRSYDPRTGTYLGYDGYRHPCP